MHDVQIGLFVPAANVVSLAQAAPGQHRPDGAAMVFDIEPIADLLPVAVHRQRFAGLGVDDHQRNELFRKVQRPVVVRAIGGQHRQAIGVVVSAHQVVAGGFAGAVGAVGLVAVCFGESWVAGC